MAQAFPDVSNHNGAMALRPGTVACLAKATEGTTYRDPYYAHFKSEAARVGALFGAYHFLREGNGAAQGQFAFGVIGPGVPVMIDFEPEYDSAGNPISQPTMADAVAFRDAFRKLGGLVRLNYLPRWYWAGHLGSPSLAPLADLGLVSSSYTGYSDTGPGWTPYGGVTPSIWQYTDSQSYSGQSVDFNAYRGTLDQLRALLGLTPSEPDMPLTEADVDLILNRQIPRQGSGITGPTSLAGMVEWNDSHVQTIINAVNGLKSAIAAPVDAKALAASLAALMQPAIVQAVQAGIAPEADQLAVVFEQHLAATLAQGK